MSFQGLDFKTSRPRAKTPIRSRDFKLSERSGFPLKILLASSLVVIAGFSATNWQPEAKAADSTPKPDRLHYSLAIPDRQPDEITVAMITPEPEPEPEQTWNKVTIKSGDTLALFLEN